MTMDNFKTTEPAGKPETADTIHELLRAVKADLRAMMNGVASASMREKGLAYKVIFGVELPRLIEMAARLPHTAALAAALWKEDIRECRLLAPMVQPAEAFPPALADEWVASMHYPEEAQVCSMQLFSRLPYASQKAFEWMAQEDPMRQLCGFSTLGRLLGSGARPSERDAHELLDQAEAALKGPHAAVSRAAGGMLMKYSDLGRQEERQVEALLLRISRECPSNAPENPGNGPASI